MMRAMRTTMAVGILAWCGALSGNPSWGIEFGQVDTFENGGPANWQHGESSPTPPVVVTDGDNHVLKNVSSGNQGPGSKLVLFNSTQWAGDYLAVGVDRIEFDVRNTSGETEPVFLRLSFNGANTLFSSTQPYVVQDDGLWHSARFNLNSDSLNRLLGTASLANALANVSVLRIVSAKSGPSFNGDTIASSIFLDNIHATFIPSPADLNADRSVDASDAGIMFANWGQSGDGDINQDGIVDAADAGEMFAVWTGDARSAAALTRVVPEPWTSGIFMLGCWGVLQARRRRGAMSARLI